MADDNLSGGGWKPAKGLFRTGGRYPTQGMFIEHRYGVLADAVTVYTLDTEDKTGTDGTFYRSLYKLYMDTDDLTEWAFVQKYMDSWEHWEALCATSWFAPLIARWRLELETRTRAKALKEIIFEAENGGKNSYEANKFLVGRGWKPKPDNTAGTDKANRRGRPSKEQVQAEAERMAEAERQVKQDLHRLTN